MDIDVVFPKYMDMDRRSIVIRRCRPYYRGEDILCKYYRPCGEWSCIIKYKKYSYWYTFGFDGQLDFKPVEINLITPEEFLNDNAYCISEATARMFKEAWEDIPEDIKDHQDIWEEIDEEGTSHGWCHKEYYKDLNYKYTNIC